MNKKNIFKKCLSGVVAISIIASCLSVGMGYLFASATDAVEDTSNLASDTTVSASSDTTSTVVDTNVESAVPSEQSAVVEESKDSKTEETLVKDSNELTAYGTSIFKSGVTLGYNGDLTNGCTTLFSLDGNAITPAKDNILSGKTPDATAYSPTTSEKFNVKYNELDPLTDNIANVSSDIYNRPEIDLIYQLTDTYTLENFVMINRNEDNLQTVSYALYASDTYKGVLDESAWLATYEKDGEGQCNVFNFTGVTNAKYFRIKLLDGNESQDATYRLCELMLFGNKTGTAPKSPLVEDDSTEFISIFDSDISISSTKYLGRDANSTSEGTVTVYNEANLHDGTNSESSAAPRFADWDAAASPAAPVYYDDGEKVYVKIIYDLGNTADISNILVMNHATKALRTSHYKLYIGDDLDTLFNSSNLAYEYKNDNMLMRQVYTFDGEFAQSGRYVAMKVDFPTCGRENYPVTTVDEEPAHNNIYLRLLEFNVWGKYQGGGSGGSEPDVKPVWEKATGTYMTNAELKSLGTSLIDGQIADAKLKFVTAPVTTLNRLKWLTDGNIEKTTQYHGNEEIHTDLDYPKTTDGSEPLDFIYKLGDGETPYDLSRILYIGYGYCDMAYATGHYQVYAAVDYDDLFAPESMIFEYNYLTDGDARGHIVTYKEGHYPRACYFAVRILNPVATATTWVYARVSEIAVYGEKAVIPKLPTNLAVNMPVNAYLSDNGKNVKEISTKYFDLKQAEDITDSNNDTYVDFSKKGKQLDFIYNLCGTMNIDAINVSSVAEKAKYLPGFKIYASDDLNKIWSEDSLVFTCSKTTQQTTGVNFSKSKAIRYVRISFPKASDSVRIADIGIIGLDNQQFKYKNLAPTLNPADITFFKKNNKTGNIKYLALTYEQSAGLINRDKKTNCTVWGGTGGKDSFNIQMYFPDLKNISTIESYFIDRHTDYWPVGMKIYVGETLNDILDENAKPVIVFDEKPENGKYVAEFLPRLARYIRFEIPENNPGLKDIYEDITVAFTEIYLNGTAVKGMQYSDESDTLINWKDKKTGIEWEIVRLDKNDIYTEIAESRLVPYDATVRLKSSLNQYPYYKIVKDKLYKIEFYDVFGNEITDFNSRLLRVKVPIDKEYTDGRAVIGVTYDRKNMVLYETAYDTTSSKSYVTATFDYEVENDFLFAYTLYTDENDKYWNGIPEAGTMIDEDEDDNVSDGYIDGDINFGDIDINDLLNGDFDFGDIDINELLGNFNYEDLVVDGTIIDGTNVPDESPATGESNIVYIVLSVMLFAMGLVVLTFRKKTNEEEI